RERYPSAKELAEDLKRFETGQLVSAHQYSVWALAQRWFRYHRVSMAVVAGCFVVLTAMGLVSLRRLIREHLAEARRNQLLLVQARSSLDRDPTATVAWLKQYPADATEWRAVRDAVVQAENEGIAKHVIRSDLALPALSPDGKMLVTSTNQEVQVWDA